MSVRRKVGKFIMGLALGITSLLVVGFDYTYSGSALYHTINVKTPADTKDFFRYTKDRIPFVSAHRGGPMAGFPENCIATFENTISQTYAILEIDPHFTKDSAIVVMHDKTLDRTSNGTGAIANYTLAELRKLKLEDVDGKLTPYGIPTLDEVLQWAKGKTILVIDAKEVPVETRVKKIVENQAEANAIVIVYSYAEAKQCYAMNKNIVMELMVPNRKKFDELDATGIPWENIIAFVTHTKPESNEIFQLIHDKGSMCIVGSSRTVDREYTRGSLKNYNDVMEKYRAIVHSGADVIEADLAIDAGKAIDQYRKNNSSKAKYFQNPGKPKKDDDKPTK